MNKDLDLLNQSIADAVSAISALDDIIAKGDVVGHPFRGNQYQNGQASAEHADENRLHLKAEKHHDRAQQKHDATVDRHDAAADRHDAEARRLVQRVANGAGVGREGELGMLQRAVEHATAAKLHMDAADAHSAAAQSHMSAENAHQLVPRFVDGPERARNASINADRKTALATDATDAANEASDKANRR